MPPDQPPPFRLGPRLTMVQRICGGVCLATMVADWLGASFFDEGFGFKIQLTFGAILAGTVAYDFFKSGPSSRAR